MSKKTILIVSTISLLIILGGIQACQGEKSISKKTPNYWNQLEYDSVAHQVYQKRWLDLKLAGNNPEKLKNKKFILNTSWDDDLDKTFQFSEKGAFSKKVVYAASYINLEIPQSVLKDSSDIHTVSYHWYHPNQWFKTLELDILTEQLSIIYKPSETPGWIEIEINYPPHLKTFEANGHFGGMLGWGIDLTGEYEKPKRMCWIKSEKSGKITAIMDLLTFFKEYKNSYSTPYKVGDKYNLRFELVLELPQGQPTSIMSSKKDPPHKPIKYGPVKFGRGNYHGDLPKTTPTYQIEIQSSKEITLQAEHLDF